VIATDDGNRAWADAKRIHHRRPVRTITDSRPRQLRKYRLNPRFGKTLATLACVHEHRVHCFRAAKITFDADKSDIELAREEARSQNTTLNHFSATG
jgi:hypothetical protein